ncbi:MAG: DcaP family trimeric outer membrane transporter [Rikenellaceae bacterium]
MKAIRLLIAAMLLTSATAASARDGLRRAEHQERRETPSVLFILDGATSSSSSDSSTNSDSETTEQQLYQFDTPEKLKLHLREKDRESRAAKEFAKAAFIESHRTGYQSTDLPLLLFTQRNNKFTFGVGGYISLRTSYDFNGTVENIDFVPADIPITSSYDNKQQLMMDGSTSRLYFKAMANTRALGMIEVFVDMDFRGNTAYNDSGVVNRYSPRLRTAYASFLGFTIGRDVTTFCDLDAAPRTIDFQGPNAYGFNYATLLRYQYSCCNDRLEMAVALEQPNVSGTYASSEGVANFKAIPQRVPDVPMYIEYKMGAERQHHFRVTGVLRDMYLYNAITMENTTLLGWGVKASGNLKPFDWIDLCFNGTYGEGITPYIQDLNGSGLDFTPNPITNTAIQTMPMFGWQAAATFYFTNRLSAAGGYSMAQVQHENGYYSASEYKQGQYAFGNMFYDVTPRFTVACEFIYGYHKEMSCAKNTAHRASLMGQFSF